MRAPNFMRAGALLFSLLPLGCGQGREEAPTPSENSEATEAPASSGAPENSNAAEGAVNGATPEGASAEDLAALEAEGRALLQTWLRAQNEGEFDAYRPLYAERFTGIKRSAERVRSYDRDGWIENRERMFQRPMTVTAEDIVVEASARMVVMTFVQGWSSATYQDRGPKRIVAVREGSGLRIVSEEMLRSETPAPRSDDLRRFMPIVSVGQAHIVLASQADPAWERGPPETRTESRWRLGRQLQRGGSST